MIAHGMPPSDLSMLGDLTGSATTSERQIWEAAIILVREHGNDAADVAGVEAEKHRGDPDHLKYVVWSWIARATAELVKAAPEPGEYLN